MMPYLNGRPPDRCYFYIKKLPSSSAAASASSPVPSGSTIANLANL
jgi:hypothetical protein